MNTFGDLPPEDDAFTKLRRAYSEDVEEESSEGEPTTSLNSMDDVTKEQLSSSDSDSDSEWFMEMAEEKREHEISIGLRESINDRGKNIFCKIHEASQSLETLEGAVIAEMGRLLGEIQSLKTCNEDLKRELEEQDRRIKNLERERQVIKNILSSSTD